MKQFVKKIRLELTMIIILLLVLLDNYLENDFTFPAFFIVLGTLFVIYISWPENKRKHDIIRLFRPCIMRDKK